MKQYSPVVSEGSYESWGSDEPKDISLDGSLDLEDGRRPDWRGTKDEWMQQLASTSLSTVPRNLRETVRQTPRLVKLVVSMSAIIIVGLVFLLFTSQPHRPQIDGTDPRALARLLKETPWNRAISRLSDDQFPGAELYQDTLGSQVAIIDVDDRPWNITDPAAMNQLSWGRLNHFLYAEMHGYDYKYYKAPTAPEGVHGTWTKVAAIHDVIQQGYKYVVFLDSDAIFPHLKIPVEFFLDHWNITSEIAVAVGLAQDLPNRYDRTHHNRIVNTGFMIVQATEVTDELFRDWEECVTDVKYPGCSYWANEYWHEQNAYSDYIRYDYAANSREISCDEVSGAPQHPLEGEKHCDGTLITHYFMAKNAVKEAVERSITEILLTDTVENMIDLHVNTQGPY